MFARIFLAGIVAALLASPAHAQGWMRTLSEIGGTPAARQLAAGVARRSDLALKILEGVGFKVGSEAAAAEKWQSLSSAQLGAIITRDDQLTSRFLGSQRLNTEDRELWFSGINTIRAQKLDIPALETRQSSRWNDTADPTILCDQRCRSALRYGGGGVAAASSVPAADYFGRLIKSRDQQ